MTITLEELQLAARNHGMPLEALRYPTTPIGLHYLLHHFDLPESPADWRLEVGGRVRQSLSLSLAELHARSPVRMQVTMECAGNGRAHLDPRPPGQPWLAEAVGTGAWGGTLLRELLAEAVPLDGAVDVVFTGLDRGIDGGVEHAYERSLTVTEALGGDALLAYELNGEPLPHQHGSPLRLVVPGWYGMASVKWLGAIEAIATPYDGYQNTVAYRYSQSPADSRRTADREARCARATSRSPCRTSQARPGEAAHRAAA